MDEYDGPERRRNATLTEEQLHKLAEQAAEIAIQKLADRIFADIGRTFVRRALVIAGAGVIVFYLYIKTGKLPTI